MPAKTAKNGKPKVEADGSGPIPKEIKNIIKQAFEPDFAESKKALLKYINGLRKQIPAAS